MCQGLGGLNRFAKLLIFCETSEFLVKKKHSAMLKSKKHARKLSRINYLSRLEILSTSQVTPM